MNRGECYYTLDHRQLCQVIEPQTLLGKLLGVTSNVRTHLEMEESKETFDRLAGIAEEQAWNEKLKRPEMVSLIVIRVERGAYE
jgi:hypothetical protein